MKAGGHSGGQGGAGESSLGHQGHRTFLTRPVVLMKGVLFQRRPPTAKMGSCKWGEGGGRSGKGSVGSKPEEVLIGSLIIGCHRIGFASGCGGSNLCFKQTAPSLNNN